MKCKNCRWYNPAGKIHGICRWKDEVKKFWESCKNFKSWTTEKEEI